MMYLFMIGGVIALASTVFLVRLRRQRRQASLEELAESRATDIRHWAEEVIACGGDVPAIVRQGSMPHISSTFEILVEGINLRLNDEVGNLAYNATTRYNQAVAAEERIPELKGFLNEKSRENGLFKLLQYLQNQGITPRRFTEEMLNVSTEDVRQELQSLAEGRLNNLTESANRGDAEAFDKLMQFFDKHYAYSKSRRDYAEVGLKFSMPSEWDELMVRFYESPSVHHFANLEPNQPAGFWRQMAAEVVRNHGSLVDALKVLAVADMSWRGDYVWRDEIGDRLLSDLAKLVRRLRAKQATADVILRR